MPSEVEPLIDAAVAFLTPLRMGEGLDPQRLDELCAAFRRCGAVWAEVDVVPKVAAGAFVDLFAVLDDAAFRSRGDERGRLLDASGKLFDLVQTALAPRGV